MLTIIFKEYRLSLQTKDYDCQEQVNERFKKSLFKNKSENEYSYTSNLHLYNIAEELFNSVAETTDCKQFVSHTLI